MVIAEHLNFDMARFDEIFFDQDGSIAEAALPSRWAPSSAVLNAAGSSTRRMPLPPPPARALIKTGIADAVGLGLEKVSVLVVAVVTGHDRHLGFLHQRLGRVLEAHRPDRGSGRADETQAGGGHGIDKVSVLGKKAVAWMNSLRRRFGGQPR